MPDLVRVTIETRDAVQVAAVTGDVDIASVGDVKSALLRAVDNESLGLVLDLTHVRYLDSSAVGLLFELADGLRRRGQRLRLVIGDGALARKTLLLTGVDSVAALDRDVSAALEGVRRRVR